MCSRNSISKINERFEGVQLLSLWTGWAVSTTVRRCANKLLFINTKGIVFINIDAIHQSQWYEKLSSSNKIPAKFDHWSGGQCQDYLGPLCCHWVAALKGRRYMQMFSLPGVRLSNALPEIWLYNNYMTIIGLFAVMYKLTGIGQMNLMSAKNLQWDRKKMCCSNKCPMILSGIVLIIMILWLEYIWKRWINMKLISYMDTKY